LRLLIKFNLVFTLVFLVGLGISAYVSWTLLQQNAREETIQDARLVLEAALATRSYTSSQIRPLLVAQMEEKFLPQSVPAYGAGEVLEGMRKKFPEYTYREATLNPTNPRNRAVDWEADIISVFRNSAESKEIIAERDTPSGRVLYIAKPMRITDPACLVCHSTVDAAPKSMVDRYGPANGFGWNLNEVIGAQVVAVPMAVPFQRAVKAFQVFIISLTAVFLGFGLVGNLMLWRVVISPVTRLAKLADRVSLGEMDAPEFIVKSRDEIGVLTESFSRMRKGMAQAMKMLEGGS
jgi:protein-histidine pros-kinase